MPTTTRRSRFDGAEGYLPPRRDLASLSRASRDCRGCDLYRQATQTVFGEGAADARLVLVGEAPGDREDLAGTPFVGPAGRLLDALLEEAGIARSGVYLTNAVKHFRFVLGRDAKVRLHKSPTAAQLAACRPWLMAEFAATIPAAVVCLGATAARSLLGPASRISERRGEVIDVQGLPPLVLTYHPSAVLRAGDPEARARLRAELVADLRTASAVAAELGEDPVRAEG